MVISALTISFPASLPGTPDKSAGNAGPCRAAVPAEPVRRARDTPAAVVPQTQTPQSVAPIFPLKEFRKRVFPVSVSCR